MSKVIRLAVLFVCCAPAFGPPAGATKTVINQTSGSGAASGLTCFRPNGDTIWICWQGDPAYPATYADMLCSPDMGFCWRPGDAYCPAAGSHMGC